MHNSDGTVLPPEQDAAFRRQFNVEENEHVDKVDFLDWYRFYFLFKDVLSVRPRSVLEIGSGSGVLKNCIKPKVARYEVFDINPNLKPDYLGDIRKRESSLKGRYDAVIGADVLEHIPFDSLRSALENIHEYLEKGGHLFVTIPHRRSHFLWMTPTYIPHVLTVPTGFLSPGSFYRRFIKRKIWIDPNHCWEIGDGTVTVKAVEEAFKDAGFVIHRFKKLLYVDYWVLRKP